MNNQNPWVLIHQDNDGTITSAMEIEHYSDPLYFNYVGHGNRGGRSSAAD